MNIPQLKTLARLLAMAAAFVLASLTARADGLLVGDFNGTNSGVKLYNGTTGVFEKIFVPYNSGGLTFPLGGAIGPDGNLYVSNSDMETVLRYNSTTGAFIDAFVPSGTGGLGDPA